MRLVKYLKIMTTVQRRGIAILLIQVCVVFVSVPNAWCNKDEMVKVEVKEKDMGDNKVQDVQVKEATMVPMKEVEMKEIPMKDVSLEKATQEYKSGKADFADKYVGSGKGDASEQTYADKGSYGVSMEERFANPQATTSDGSESAAYSDYYGLASRPSVDESHYPGYHAEYRDRPAFHEAPSGDTNPPGGNTNPPGNSENPHNPNDPGNSPPGGGHNPSSDQPPYPYGNYPSGNNPHPSDQPPYPYGDYPGGSETPGSDQPPYPHGDQPPYPYGDYPSGDETPGSDGPSYPSGDQPPYPYGDYPSGDETPGSDEPHDPYDYQDTGRDGNTPDDYPTFPTNVPGGATPGRPANRTPGTATGAGKLDVVPPPTCHCQGSRLLIVLGDFSNPRIALAREWAKGLLARKASRGRLQILSYGDGKNGDLDMDHPYIPSRISKSGWKRLEHLTQQDKKHETLEPDFCYFDEVLVLLDGERAQAWTKLVEHLGFLLNSRPVRNMAVWCLAPSAAFLPSSPPGIYERLCGVVRPKDCPCECDRQRCKAFDSDGHRTHCPHHGHSVAIATAGVREGKAAALSLDSRDALSPLVSPDGQLRVITIRPDGSILAKIIPAKGRLFGPLRVKAGREAHVTAASGTSLKQSHIVEPSIQKHYAGPMACQGREGCITDSGQK